MPRPLPGMNPNNPPSGPLQGQAEKGTWSPYALGRREDTYQAPGMPPVSMEHRQWGETLKQRVAEDQAQTDRTATVQRPDFYEDPERALEFYQYMAQTNLKSKDPADHKMAHYYQGLAHGIEQAGAAQRRRLETYYKQRPDMNANVPPPTSAPRPETGLARLTNRHYPDVNADIGMIGQ